MSYARQPILHADGGLEGYELLAPAGPAHAGALGALVTADLRSVGGSREIHLDVTPAALLAFNPLPFAPDGLVLELPGEYPLTPEVLDRVHDLRHSGYRFALDAVRPDSPGAGLLPSVEIAKVDAATLAAGEETELVRWLEQHRVIPAVYNVATREQRDLFVAAGFVLVQGDFVSRPSAFPDPPAPASLSRLRAAAQIAATGDAEALTTAISRDPALSLRLLQFVNSAAIGLRSRISSVPHAVRMLGPRAVRQWAMLVLVSGDGAAVPSSLLALALARARTCESIAERLGMEDKEAYFMVGLLSVADAMLDARMSDVLADLPLAEDIRAALLSGAGGKGRALRMATLCEHGAWDEAAIPHLDAGVLCALHAEALAWADGVVLGLAPASAARAA